jgi:histidine triad (HIT) family protein
MASVFTRIIQGEIPSYKLAEDERFIAILDAFPLVEGHTLVIPKQEVDYIFDLGDDVLGDLMKFAKKIAPAIQKVIPCVRLGVTVIGLEVPHTHIHLIPIHTMDDMNFMKPKIKIAPERMESIANAIRIELSMY